MTASTPSPTRRLTLPVVRSSNERWVAGVAGGIGARLRVDPVIVRLSFVVLAVAGGFGLVVYGVLWALLREAPTSHVHRDGQAAALGLVVLGLLGLLRDAGLWPGDGIVWPLALAAAGSALIWMRGGDDERARLRRLARVPESAAIGEGTRVPQVRLLVGAALVAAGALIFLAVRADLAAIGQIGLAVLVTAAGAGLIAGPWIASLLARMDAERRDRIRSEERAEIAAHLHDSVLQTLALIQRHEDPHDVRSLARRQERELRAWLHGSGRGSAADLRAALDTMIDEVEADHAIAVETVVVGDARLDPAGEVALAACREALTNAAKHAGVDRVSLYLETEPDLVTAFVRDRGRGFDPAEVGDDRRGITGSIVGRAERAGGSAEVRSTPGEGTEVEIRVPRQPVRETSA